MNLRCALWGHKTPDYDYYPMACERCGKSESLDEVWGFWQWWGVRAPYYWARFHLREMRTIFRCRHRNFKNWLTCEECGWHCGHHDPRVDHVPF